MTNYIEEMMKTAECKGHPRACHPDCEGNCQYCDWYNSDIIYPDFTAEKQLEIIKLIGKQEVSVRIYTIPYENDGFHWFISIPYKNNTFCCQNKDFAEALAQLTTELMNEDKLDKSKVKEILEQ